MQKEKLTSTPPTDSKPLYLDEEWLIDPYFNDALDELFKPKVQDDLVKVLIPLNLSQYTILRRLDNIIDDFGAASEDNEYDYSSAVDRIVYQLEVYDEIWRDRLSLEEGKHSEYAIKLAKKIIDKLEDIPDHCAECFPFETIENLTDEYLSDD